MLSYKIRIFRKMHNQYYLIHCHKLNPSKKFYSFEKKTFTIDLNHQSYIVDKCAYFDFDENGMQITYNENQNMLMSTETLDVIINNKIVSDMTKSIAVKPVERLFTILLGVILGSLITALICILYYQQQIVDIYKDVANTAITTPIIPYMANLSKMLVMNHYF